MKSITIHQIDPETSKKLEKIAKEKNLSLNKLIKQLLQKSLGINTNMEQIRNDEFQEFLGIWDEKQLNEVEKRTESLNSINSEDWE